MCNCIELVNDGLSKLNAAIDVPHRIDFNTGKTLAPIIPVPVFKLDPKKRSRLPTILAIFCPFCGVKYETATEPQSVSYRMER